MGLTKLTIQTGNYEIPEFPAGPMSPEDIQEKMAQSSYLHRHAIEQLKRVEREKTIAEAQITLAVQAKRVDLLTDPAAVELFNNAMEDPKFKPTIDFTNSLVYVEARPIMEEYQFWENIAKREEKQFQMLVSQQMWYMSENKRTVAEAFASGAVT